MADLDKLTDEATTKAALAVGKRAIDDLLSSDEETAQEEAKRSATSKSRRTKLIVYGVVGLLILVGLLGLVVSYWQWFLLLGLLSAAGLYGWYRVRKRFGAKKDATNEVAATPATSQLRVAEHESESPAHDPQQLEEEIDDELAAMKARLGK